MSSTPAPFRVASFDATPIAYDIYDAPSRSAALVIPGFWRERRHPSMVAFASMLTEHGYRTAVTDPRGHGESGGVYGFNLHEQHDTAAVIRDLVARTSAERVTLIGFSYGGAIAISAAARNDLPIASILLISPVADFAMIAPRLNPFTMHRHIALRQALQRPRFDWRIRRSTKLRALDDIPDVRVPLCFMHVKNDWLIGHAHSEALYDAANEPKELHVFDIPGNYHADRIFAVAKDQVEPVMLSFLERYA